MYNTVVAKYLILLYVHYNNTPKLLTHIISYQFHEPTSMFHRFVNQWRQFGLSGCTFKIVSIDHGNQIFIIGFFFF